MYYRSASSDAPAAADLGRVASSGDPADRRAMSRAKTRDRQRVETADAAARPDDCWHAAAGTTRAASAARASGAAPVKSTLASGRATTAAPTAAEAAVPAAAPERPAQTKPSHSEIIAENFPIDQAISMMMNKYYV